ncbi:hypothetical protein BIFPSEUDO_04412 [Bifidobacterium pseudocatenulatum DSM 20438 = JCM 1200 = LMG 10505]|uniref:Uncharacterized protein n=1 Tax=Bifidobacterium pseudocatenulatum DSM 20438 = JCM 1200 = LMG 10505 TaxID=547043 RepID=C0BVG7_BIFPS|nr:hypothetical protein BIFPSEUDO_04412 [Bifidobacterium pseudocatenulatum DSM 20438 = JCM 1200 = LMG 10505]
MFSATRIRYTQMAAQQNLGVSRLFSWISHRHPYLLQPYEI